MSGGLKIMMAAVEPLTDGQIILALQALPAQLDEAERLTRAALMAVLESRHVSDVAAAMDAWENDLETDQTQEQALIAAVLASC